MTSSPFGSVYLTKGSSGPAADVAFFTAGSAERACATAPAASAETATKTVELNHFMCGVVTRRGSKDFPPALRRSRHENENGDGVEAQVQHEGPVAEHRV